MAIPNSVTTIGNGAFYGCSGLTSVVIPNSVTSIGYGAFSGCSELSYVEYNAAKCHTSELVDIYGVEVAPFRNCYKLTKVEIGDGVTTIPKYLFSGCN